MCPLNHVTQRQEQHNASRSGRKSFNSLWRLSPLVARGIVDGSKIGREHPGPVNQIWPTQIRAASLLRCLQRGIPTFRALHCKSSAQLVPAAFCHRQRQDSMPILAVWRTPHNNKATFLTSRRRRLATEARLLMPPKTPQCPHSKVQSSHPVAASFANHLQPWLCRS